MEFVNLPDYLVIDTAIGVGFTEHHENIHTDRKVIVHDPDILIETRIGPKLGNPLMEIADFDVESTPQTQPQQQQPGQQNQVSIARFGDPG